MAQPWRVMIVNKSQENALEISNAFAQANFVARTYGARDDALAELRDFKPHLIISDYDVPGIPLDQFIGVCATEAPSCRVLVVAGKGTAWLEVKKLKADSMLHYPLVMDVLVDHAIKLVTKII